MKEFFLNVLAVVFGLFVVLGLTEAGIRLYGALTPLPGREAPERPLFFVKPGNPADHGHEFHALKYANERYQVPKPENVYRIAAIGDSFTYPYEVQLDDVYSKRLERLINIGKASSTQTKAEVVNYGMAGLGSEEEVFFVNKAILEGAQVVVLQITLNDPTNDDIANKEVTIKKYGHKYTFWPLKITKEQTPLLYYVKTLGFIAERIQNYRIQQSTNRYHHDLFTADGSWRRFSHAIETMKAVCDQHHVPLVAMVMPMFNYPMDAHYPYLDLHQKVDSYLEQRNILTLDLLSAYQGIPMERLELRIGKDGHPNEIAHRIASERLYLFLEEKGLIPSELRIETKLISRLPKTIPFDPTKVQ